MKTKETILRYMTKQFRTLFVLALALFSVLTVQAQAPVKTQPRIGGAVFGGGRMADVGTNTVVTIVNCDTISAVYGGNDIAGTVAGANGSTIAVGTLTGNARGVTNGEINIGSVYGGGNGYYKYDNNAPGVAVGTTVLTGRTFSTSVTDVAGGDSYVSSGTIPSIGKTSITVNTDFVRIDSLFGGAKNAFITGTEGNNTYIDINGGVIYAVFGGNNFGGTLAAAKQVINVDGTKTNTSSSVNLGGTYANGRAWTSDDSEHGIRYLFGGGNKVSGKTVEIYVYGGQIDTLFGGGNSADVTSTTVNVNVTSPLYTLATSPYTDPATYAYSTTTSVFDIRCLFGGNNAADMSGLPTLNLTQGGVHNVYGGGNKGVMLAAVGYEDNYVKEDLTPSDAAYNKGNAKKSTNIVVSSDDFIADTIYGGGQSAGTLHDTYVEIADGNVGVVYGGTNIMGRIGPEDHTGLTLPRNLAKTNVWIHGGTVYNAVFGGSNGYYRCHNGEIYSGDTPNVLMANEYDGLKNKPTPAVFKTYVLIEGGNIQGNVFSSGNMAAVGKPAAIASTPNLDSAGIAILHIKGGTIGTGTVGTITKAGAVYGGGNMGNVFGGSDLRIYGNSAVIYGDVYGGNNKTGRVFATLRNGASTPSELAGASTNAAVSVSSSEYQYLPDLTAGSPMSLSDFEASTYTLITGTPKIWGSLYGGGNGDYEYVNSWNAAGTTAKEKVVLCSNTYDATQKSSFVDVNLTNGGYIAKVFGGGNSKTVGTDGGKALVYLNCASGVPSADETNINVGTIFGGNNNVDMDAVPQLVLLQGKAEKVYGGGNLGGMTGEEPVSGLTLSTYVALASENVVVTKDVYAGCNAADVENDTYVKMRKGKVLRDIFGGNDAAGEVGVSHVLIDGAGAATEIRGSVYGGGNGNYAFYEYNHTPNVHSGEPHTNPYYIAEHRNDPIVYADVKGRPFVDSTAVVLTGTMVLNNVYGGGVSGDCRKTNVLVDAEGGVFNGMIFGAGKGRVDNVGIRLGGDCKDLYIGIAQFDNEGHITYGTGTAMGNVLDTAFLTVRQFASMGGNGGRSAMFGGGQAGNVRTTYVTYENTAVHKLKALYLGCLASNVENAVGVIDAYEPDGDDAIIDTIYGGNDFTGRVGHTNLVVNSGKFVHLFGAGNGDVSTTGVTYTGTEPNRDVEYYKEWIEMSRLWSDDDDKALLQKKNCNCYDTVPYSMDVNVTINGGEFLNTVYGGGNMGLVGDRDMTRAEMTDDQDGRHSRIGYIELNVHGGKFNRHIFTGARGKVDMKSKYFDTWEVEANADPVVAARAAAKNVDNGDLGKQLAYAQKILNMDGGVVAFSVYGGSEAVDDGFPYECIGAVNNAAVALENTTLRPSSILNITGGRIEKSVYGGGYQGNIYGSVYVNVGIDAVRDSKVWTKEYGTSGHIFTLANYKPNLTDHSGYDISTVYSNGNITKTVVPKDYTNVAGRSTLKKAVVDLEASIYNASDWGEAGSAAYFSTRGVFGGETNLLVDGKGYYTSLTDPFNVDLPSMNIANSIIGAGTSTEGGDVNRFIMMRHFGDYSCPDPSKNLFSIQRADKVVLDSVFINLYGEQDAFQAYASPSYSLCRIDTLLFRIDNIVMVESPGIYIGNIASLKTDELYSINDPNQIYKNVEVDQPVTGEDAGGNDIHSQVPNDFFDNLSPNDHNECTENYCQNLDVCMKLPSERGSSGSVAAFNVLMMRNGSYVKVSPFVDNNTDGVDDPNHHFGHVYGWMYMLAQDATMSYVYADVKDGGHNATDGGFVAPCYCDNLDDYPKEIDYTNVDLGGSGDYRSWKVGKNQGTRVRHITLVANVHPDHRLNEELPAATYDRYIGASSTPATTGISVPEGYAYATTTLELPPADGGSFYIINSVLIDQDNGGQLSLIDQAYDKGRNSFIQTTTDQDITLPFSAITAQPNSPDHTFGLAFSSAENFKSGPWNTSEGGHTILPSVSDGNITRQLVDASSQPYPCWKNSTISGNAYITTQGGFISEAIVTNAVGAIPTMNFTLTYNKNLHSTITRDVVFTMLEFDKDGHYVGPVEVTVTISTVINDFADLEAPVLAMFNEGITNEYVRKITIPASFQQRDIYIEGIEWMKDDNTPDGGYTVMEHPNKKKWFNMIEYDGTVVESNSKFAVIITPTEATSENVNNTLGWYHISKPDGLDVYTEAKKDYETTTGMAFRTDANGYKTDSIYNSLTAHNGQPTNMGKGGNYGKGIWLGTLDGRSTASIDVTLKFNGMWYYHKQYTPPLAWVRLKCHYYSTKSSDEGEFYINVKIRTRLEGDTIYMAPGKTLTRTAVTPDGTTKTIKMHAYGYGFVEGSPQTPDNWDPPVDREPNYTSLTTEVEKEKIKDNPNNYLQDFRQVMLIYDEGDVIDIMETIPITGGDPVSVMGDDYSTIQIIRYSGSHYKFPTLGCANYNPLIEVAGDGVLTMRNVWFNGSGCTRTKEGITTETTEIRNDIPGTEGRTWHYLKEHRRVNELLFAQSPILYCHGRGNVSFNKRVILSNNFNNSYDRNLDDNEANVNYLGGGAIAIVKDLSTNDKPRVTLGDRCHLFDNVVVDWNAATAATGGTSDWLPRNYGAGVYVDGGELVIGSGSKDSWLQVKRNYYLKNTSSGAGVQTKKARVFTDADETESSMDNVEFDVYYLDTLKNNNYFALSNVYLTRKPKVCDNTDDNVTNPIPLARLDVQSDVVYFRSEMSEDSRVGISKWFPGYVYDNSRAGVHTLDEETPRDTIAIARIGSGKSNTSMVDNNYNAHIFFNDSSFMARGSTCLTNGHDDGHGNTIYDTVKAFDSQYPTVAYSNNTDAYPNYGDRVFIFRHTSLDQYNIYFQRCGSFGKGVTLQQELGSCFTEVGHGLQFNKYVKGDSISYHWNKNATCALAMDTIQFRVGGGFFPYTYKWYDVSDTVAGVVDRKDLHSRTTVGSNAISRYGTANDEYARLRKKAEFDTLVFRLEVLTNANRHNYAFEVTATDLTGNCPVTQDVKVRAVKVTDDHLGTGKYINDYANFLQHRRNGALANWESLSGAALESARTAAESTELFYRISAPGVDSSSFHDHSNAVKPHAHDGETNDATGGFCRAGYTHTDVCPGEDDTYSGKPYKGDGSCDDGDMTPRYLRVFQSFTVKPSFYPVAASGSIRITDALGRELQNMDSTFINTSSTTPTFEVCPGEVLHFEPTTNTRSTWDFIGWDYDPSSPEAANFVVGASSALNNPVVHYAPGDYWWQIVTRFENHTGPATNELDRPHTATLDDYDLDYYGNVTIKTEKGLAWLISTVNGYNSQNAQTFHFNTITLDPTDGTPFDMSAHKWTPLGNANNPFEGVFDGNGKHVTNIIVNETTLPLVGMFGQTRGATIKNFNVDSTLVRGNTYVSAIVGEALDNTIVRDINIQEGAIFGEYTIGGFISHMVNSSLINCSLSNSEGNNVNRIGAYGNAIYAGGFLGLLEGVDTVRNNYAAKTYINISKLSALYVGAIIGYSKGAVVMNKSNNRTIFNNNYARLVTSNTSQRVGGLIGYAKDIEMNNNYVYGVADYDKNNGFVGGIAGFIDDNVRISNCYYVDGMAENMVGFNLGTAPQKSTTFKGKGNNVLLTERVDGYSNLTRALNAWVRDNDSTGIYNTWRSDLENVNSGYPVFGVPDLIPVNDTLITASCENFEFDGLTFDQSGTYIFHIVDSNDFVDSTLTLMLTINYGDTTQVSDTVNLGEGYEGHGFSLTADQLRTLSQDSRVRDVYTLHFIDSLQNANGCDSLVVLTLYVVNSGVDVTEVQKLVDVKVYPNPTRGIVNVEGSDLQSIEVYDNVSRRVLSKKVEGDKTIFDLNDQAAGAYYVRIRTANGTVVKKVIKK